MGAVASRALPLLVLQQSLAAPPCDPNSAAKHAGDSDDGLFTDDDVSDCGKGQLTSGQHACNANFPFAGNAVYKQANAACNKRCASNGGIWAGRWWQAKGKMESTCQCICFDKVQVSKTAPPTPPATHVIKAGSCCIGMDAFDDGMGGLMGGKPDKTDFARVLKAATCTVKRRQGTCEDGSPCQWVHDPPLCSYIALHVWSHLAAVTKAPPPAPMPAPTPTPARAGPAVLAARVAAAGRGHPRTIVYNPDVVTPVHALPGSSAEFDDVDDDHLGGASQRAPKQEDSDADAALQVAAALQQQEERKEAQQDRREMLAWDKAHPVAPDPDSEPTPPPTPRATPPPPVAAAAAPLEDDVDALAVAPLTRSPTPARGTGGAASAESAEQWKAHVLEAAATTTEQQLAPAGADKKLLDALFAPAPTPPPRETAPPTPQAPPTPKATMEPHFQVGSLALSNTH